jgi:hypothetical protein
MGIFPTQNLSHDTYDRTFKELSQTFENQTLDYLGLSLPKIPDLLETELTDIEIHDVYRNLNYRLKDGLILHFMENSSITRRFHQVAHYDLRPYRRKGTENANCI